VFRNWKVIEKRVDPAVCVVNDARLLSDARSKEFCGGEFSFPLTPPALRNCGALVIDFDQVYELRRISRG